MFQDTWNNKLLNFGCFDSGFFLPPLFKGYLTTYYQTVLSLEVLKSFQVLLAILDFNYRDTIVFTSLRISYPSPSFFFFFTISYLRSESTQIDIHNATANWLVFPLSISHWSTTKIFFIHQQVHSAVVQDDFLHDPYLSFDHWFEPHNLFTIHPEHQHPLLWPCDSYRKDGVVLITHFNKFVTVSGCQIISLPDLTW